MPRKAPEPSTVKKLFTYSGNQCAHPSCKNPMISEDGSTVLGEICHITAASGNGPRYDSEMTDEERRSYDNLILLCESHHKQIDNKSNLTKYPIHVLRTWKENHEKNNSKILSNVSNEVVKSAIRQLMRPLWRMILGFGFAALIAIGVVIYIIVNKELKKNDPKFIIENEKGEPVNQGVVEITKIFADSTRQSIIIPIEEDGTVEIPDDIEDAEKLEVITNPDQPDEQKTTFLVEEIPRYGLMQVFRKKGPIPLNIKFLTLGSHAVDYFLEEKYIGDLQHPFNNATIVKNDVYKWMNEIRQKFHYHPLENYALYRSPVNESDNESPFVSYPEELAKVKTFIFKPNTKSGSFSNTIFLKDNKIIKELLSMPGWYIDGKFEDKAGYFGKKHTYRYVDEKFSKGFRAIFIDVQKSINRTENQFYDEDYDLYHNYSSFIELLEVNKFLEGDTANHLLQFEVALNSEESCVDFPYRISIHPPDTKLKVLFIKNEENENITINAAFFKKYELKGLFELNDTTNIKPVSNGNSLLNDFVLPPGEKLIVPLYLYFDWEKDNYFNSVIKDTIQESQVSKFLWDVDSLRISGVNYSIREESEIKLSFYDDIDSGSCPYAYTKDENDKWIIENHILFGFNSKRKENLDTINLQRFDGKLLIKENDPETSYLDFISILCSSDNGKSVELLPERKDLYSVDEEYVIMNQGDSIVLEFKDFKEMPDNTKYFLISKGYYIPYKNGELE